MPNPTSQHLYVMQNEFGCIKIGRSVDPWERRLGLCKSENCRVELVVAFEGGGEDEEAIHIALHQYRVAGEWFDGAGEARAAVERIFGLDPKEWKFGHNVEGAAKWLEQLKIARHAKYIYKELTRHIGLLRRASEPHQFYDLAILDCCSLAATGSRAVVRWKKRGEKYVMIWHNPERRKWRALPRFTANIEAALLVWPDDIRPQTWQGSAIECCITALIEIRRRFPKGSLP